MITLLYAPEGRRIVSAAVRRHRLPDAVVDDLVQQVAYKALRHGGDTPIAAPAAWITVCARTAALDLLRHRGRHPEVLVGDAGLGGGTRAGDGDDGDHPLLHDGGDGDDGDDGDAPPGGGDGDAALLLAVLDRVVAADPAVFAATLAYVTLAVEEPQPHPQCSAPKAGADANQVRAWRSLWYAGRHDLLPTTGRPDTAALRKARSRAGQRVRSAAEDAMAAALDRRGGRDGREGAR